MKFEAHIRNIENGLRTGTTGRFVYNHEIFIPLGETSEQAEQKLEDLRKQYPDPTFDIEVEEYITEEYR